MTRLHVLTDPPQNQNTIAFLAPILFNARLLGDVGIELEVFDHQSDRLLDCDVLAINSRFWSGAWSRHRDRALAWLDDARARVGRLLFFDRTSTPGQVVGDVLPMVDRYFKTALYSDRGNYRRAVYGSRLFSEFYHRECGIRDDGDPRAMAISSSDIGKLAVSWNTGLANYSLLGPRLSALYRLVPIRALLAPPHGFTRPRRSRPIDVSCRMGLRYKYATVGYQRQRMAERLSRHRRTDRISKLAYVRELTRSKIVASPFGYSEINYKDFEVFIAGGILLKPDMQHLETWPNLYIDGETFVAHRWDLSDVDEKIDGILSDYPTSIAIAEAAQNRYRAATCGSEGRSAFVDRFAGFVYGR